MKKLVFFFLIIPVITTVSAQIKLPGELNKVLGKDSTKVTSVLSTDLKKGSSLSNTDIINGLKEALTIGTDSSTKKLSRVDGFFTDAAIKILMPEEAKKAEKTLRNVGMSSLVDKAILSMNRAAEDAAGGVTAIFWDAIKEMTVNDGISILRGNDFAATSFLKLKTSAILTLKMRPVIQASLDKVNATQYWKDVFTAYNKFSSKKVDTDLTGYVTGKAMDGIFYEIGLEEQKIRKDPAAQVTDLLKKVFGK